MVTTKVTLNFCTGADTVAVAVPVIVPLPLPPPVAVMVAVPCPTAVNTPVIELIVPTAVLLLVHVTGAMIRLPNGSSVAAE
ncbi:Uncharacterised protein [uncultured archaeon]|nr:Uncharacterised protein [uncultured archaeon]